MALPHLVVAVGSPQCPVVFSKSTLDKYINTCTPDVTKGFEKCVSMELLVNGASCLSAAWALNCCIFAMRRDATTNCELQQAASRRRIITLSRITAPQKNAIKNLNWRSYIGESMLNLCLSICVWMSLTCDWLARRCCARHIAIAPLPQNLQWKSENEIPKVDNLKSTLSY